MHSLQSLASNVGSCGRNHSISCTHNPEDINNTFIFHPGHIEWDPPEEEVAVGAVVEVAEECHEGLPWRAVEATPNKKETKTE